MTLLSYPSSQRGLAGVDKSPPLLSTNQEVHSTWLVILAAIFSECSGDELPDCSLFAC